MLQVALKGPRTNALGLCVMQQVQRKRRLPPKCFLYTIRKTCQQMRVGPLSESRDLNGTCPMVHVDVQLQCIEAFRDFVVIQWATLWRDGGREKRWLFRCYSDRNETVVTSTGAIGTRSVAIAG